MSHFFNEFNHAAHSSLERIVFLSPLPPSSSLVTLLTSRHYVARCVFLVGSVFEDTDLLRAGVPEVCSPLPPSSRAGAASSREILNCDLCVSFVRRNSDVLHARVSLFTCQIGLGPAIFMGRPPLIWSMAVIHTHALLDRCHAGESGVRAQ